MEISSPRRRSTLSILRGVLAASPKSRGRSSPFDIGKRNVEESSSRYSIYASLSRIQVSCSCA
jgi:hypothetical protein